MGLAESWVRLDGKGLSRAGWAEKRVSEAPDRRGESNQFGFAVESYRGTAIERWWRVDQHSKRCQPVPFGGLKGGADERIADQERECGMGFVSLSHCLNDAEFKLVRERARAALHP
jgi:hypothetical protein